MQKTDREKLLKVLRRIPADAWNVYLASAAGKQLARRMAAVDDAVAGPAPRLLTSTRASIQEKAADLLGYSVMQSPMCGPWIREQLLKRSSDRAWGRLLKEFSQQGRGGPSSVRLGASRQGRAPALMAKSWRQGSNWARSFCDAFGLSEAFWRRHEVQQIRDEVVTPSEPLPPLHDFQNAAYERLRSLLSSRAAGRTALLSLPTGAGKTRVVVEAVCDHLAEKASEGGGSTVLWISHSTELQGQAWECFRAVWQVPPRRAVGDVPVRRVQPMRLVKLWGGRSADSIGPASAGPEVLIASIDQLASWIRGGRSSIERLRERNLLCTIIDEAHGVVTQEFRNVLETLGLKAERRWLPGPGAPLLVGMTATPWRRSDSQTAALRRFFSRRLIAAEALGAHPVKRLQDRGILSKVRAERIGVEHVPELNRQQLEYVERFHELPPVYLEKLARLSERNAKIIERALRLPVASKCLVFACSIDHAEVLAAALNASAGPGSAAAVTSATPRAERALVIEHFRREGGPRFLCTVGVLAAGFDAPKVSAVIITRPTMSAALYEQMVGRGLRGPANGGTASCRVIDMQDEGLPEGVYSYERVMTDWHGRA